MNVCLIIIFITTLVMPQNFVLASACMNFSVSSEDVLQKDFVTTFKDVFELFSLHSLFEKNYTTLKGKFSGIYISQKNKGNKNHCFSYIHSYSQSLDFSIQFFLYDEMPKMTKCPSVT